MIVGDGFPVPQPTDYGFADTMAKAVRFYCRDGEPVPYNFCTKREGKDESYGHLFRRITHRGL